VSIWIYKCRVAADEYKRPEGLLEALSTIPNELKKLEEKGSIVFETMHKRKDGTVFPVGASIRQ